MYNMIFSLFFFLLVTLSASAVEALTCMPVKTHNENNYLTFNNPVQAGGSRIYFLKNTGTENIFIDRAGNRTGASTGWSSYLRSGNWSALALSQKSFAFSCIKMEPGKVTILDCAKNLSICSPRLAAGSPQIKGSYWLAEDKPWNDFIKAVEKRKVKFK